MRGTPWLEEMSTVGQLGTCRSDVPGTSEYFHGSLSAVLPGCLVLSQLFHLTEVMLQTKTSRGEMLVPFSLWATQPGQRFRGGRARDCRGGSVGAAVSNDPADVPNSAVRQYRIYFMAVVTKNKLIVNTIKRFREQSLGTQAAPGKCCHHQTTRRRAPCPLSDGCCLQLERTGSAPAFLDHKSQIFSDACFERLIQNKI